MTKEYKDCVLVTIHGIKSDNRGLEELIRHCQRRLPGLGSYRVTYGTVGINIRDEATRTNIIEIVENELKVLYDRLETDRDTYPRGPQTKVFFVAHSFGTFALYKYLERRPTKLVFNEIILLGSIIPANADWDYMVSNNKDYMPVPPINIVRPFDLIVRYGKKLHNHRSVSGSRGFIGRRNYITCDHFKHGGHTDYNSNDFDDIVSIIKGDFDRKTATTELEFLQKFTLMEALKLKFLRRIGWC